uniref:Uncharacterized protein n=1 Tax=Cacopsylla melanoneura TaxID=428564 RepID=A0A8D8T5N1_9HEMI
MKMAIQNLMQTELCFNTMAALHTLTAGSVLILMTTFLIGGLVEEVRKSGPPDLRILHQMTFFLWGYLKSVVYRTPPSTIEDLKIRIQTACNNITPETFKNVRAEFHNRMFYCLEVNGQHFEHLLK